MTDLDDELRRWARTQTENAPQVHVDADLFGAQTRLRWWAPVAAAAAVIAVAGGVLGIHPWATKGHHSHVADSMSSPDSALKRSAPLAAGQASSGRMPTRESMFHGLAVLVPASWRENATHCGTPTADTTVVPSGSGQLYCLQVRPQAVSSVEWHDGPDVALRTIKAHTTSIRIGSLTATRTVGLVRETTAAQTPSAALRGNGTRPPLYVVYIVVPGAHASLTITSPSQVLAAQIGGSIKQVQQDENKCQASVTIGDISQLAVGTTTRDPNITRLIPGSPATVNVCRYESGQLERSSLVSDQSARKIARIINRLPAGLSIATTNSHEASCPGSRTDGEGYVITARYRNNAPAVSLLARIGSCGDLGISNGVVQGQRTDELVKLLVDRVGTAINYPSTVVPLR